MSAAVFLSVVIPAYNEARRLPATLERVGAYLAQQSFRSEILVVDDGSTDETAVLAERHPGVRVLKRDHRGKGFAVRAGALDARGAYILLCDADLATPIEEWEKLFPFFAAGYDVVIGSREGLGARRLGEPLHRHIMGRVFNLLVRLIAIPGINDTQCGFKALSRSAAHDLFQRVRIYGDDAPVVQGAAVTAYDVELLFLARPMWLSYCRSTGDMAIRYRNQGGPSARFMAQPARCASSTAQRLAWRLPRCPYISFYRNQGMSKVA